MNRRTKLTLTTVATAMLLLPLTFIDDVNPFVSIAISVLTLFAVLISIKAWLLDVLGKTGEALTLPITLCLIIPIWCMNVTRQMEKLTTVEWEALVGSCIIISIPVIVAFVVNEKLKNKELQTH